MIYDDEKLSPSAFEQMAKEYLKNKKKYDDNLLSIFNKIVNIKNSLKSFKLNKEYAKKLEEISTNTKSIEDVLKSKNTDTFTKKINCNYCAMLVMLITSCVDARGLLDKQDNNLNFEIKDALDNIVRTSVTMFGVCKYRKLV